MTIRTEYDPKPLPVREYDWQAVNDDYEPGDTIGFGASQEEAVADLLEKIG